MNNDKSTLFLLVEDNDSHAKLIQIAMEENHVLNKIVRIKHGDDVMCYINKEGKFSDAQRPGVILLDLNIPGKNGLELLKILKSDKDTRDIPIVILTTSRSLSDRQEAYMQYANSYLVKPVNFDKFHRMIQDLNMYWSVWNTPLTESELAVIT